MADKRLTAAEQRAADEAFLERQRIGPVQVLRNASGEWLEDTGTEPQPPQ